MTKRIAVERKFILAPNEDGCGCQLEIEVLAFAEEDGGSGLDVVKTKTRLSLCDECGRRYKVWPVPPVCEPSTR